MSNGVEILRDSDIERGGTDPNQPPLPTACFWDEAEKRWLSTASTAAVCEYLVRVRQAFRYVPQEEGPDLIAIEDA